MYVRCCAIDDGQRSHQSRFRAIRVGEVCLRFHDLRLNVSMKNMIRIWTGENVTKL